LPAPRIDATLRVSVNIIAVGIVDIAYAYYISASFIFIVSFCFPDLYVGGFYCRC